MALTDEQFHALKRLSQNKELMSQLDEDTRNRIHGLQLSRWIPVGLLRKSLMAAFMLVGILGYFSTKSLWFTIPILFALCFSPRIVGEVAMALGRINLFLKRTGLHGIVFTVIRIGAFVSLYILIKAALS